jgi:hypothetical protein
MATGVSTMDKWRPKPSMRRSLGINEGGARRKVRGRRSFPATVISRLEEPVPQPAFWRREAPQAEAR